MTWRIVCASEVGTAHSDNLTPCQDSCSAQVDLLSNKHPLLSIFVADGAGSVANGGEGAKLAVETATTFVSNKVKQGEFGLSDILATELLLAVRDRIYSVADAKRLKARDYACTIIGVISSPTGTLVMQVGDGGVVIDTGNGLDLAIVPMSGEYVNTTHFVTDEDAVTILETKTYPDRVLKVAVFTDGIQRLALNMANNKPHEPFFEPFFNVLARITDEQEDQLHVLLLRFLGSQAVNERTDDDKTIALALWKSE